MANSPKKRQARKPISPRFIFASGSREPFLPGIEGRRFLITQQREKTMDFTPKHNVRALVLFGPQGCGKTGMAEKIAERFGPYHHAGIDIFSQDFGLAPLAGGTIKTIIVDGFPVKPGEIERIKALLTDDQVTVHRKGLPPVAIKVPFLIFCTHEQPAIDHDDGRFQIVNAEEIIGRSGDD